MTDIHVTWDDYHKKTEELAIKVYEDGWQFNQVICIAKGGMRVGDVFARLFNVVSALIATSTSLHILST